MVSRFQMHSKTLFIISIIFSELKLKPSFRTMFYTLLSFNTADAVINSEDGMIIPINTVINILNRRNLSDVSNRRRIGIELDKYISIQTERNIQLFSYELLEMTLVVSFPVFNLVSKILALAELDENFAASPMDVLDRVTRQIVSECMNPIIEMPKPKPTAQQLVNKLNNTTNTIFDQFNEMIERAEVGVDIIHNEMTNYLSSTADKVMQLRELDSVSPSVNENNVENDNSENMSTNNFVSHITSEYLNKPTKNKIKVGSVDVVQPYRKSISKTKELLTKVSSIAVGFNLPLPQIQRMPSQLTN